MRFDRSITVPNRGQYRQYFAPADYNPETIGKELLLLNWGHGHDIKVLPELMYGEQVVVNHDVRACMLMGSEVNVEDVLAWLKAARDDRERRIALGEKRRQEKTKQEELLKSRRQAYTHVCDVMPGWKFKGVIKNIGKSTTLGLFVDEEYTTVNFRELPTPSQFRKKVADQLEGRRQLEIQRKRAEEQKTKLRAERQRVFDLQEASLRTVTDWQTWLDSNQPGLPNGLHLMDTGLGEFIFTIAAGRLVEARSASSRSCGSEVWREGKIISRNTGTEVVLPYVRNSDGKRVNGYTRKRFNQDESTYRVRTKEEEILWASNSTLTEC